MIFLKIPLSRHFHALLKRPKPTSNFPFISSTTHFIYPNSPEVFTFCQRPISASAQIEPELEGSSRVVENADDNKINKKKPLDVVFKEAVGLCEKLKETESENENENESDLKKSLRKLERKIKALKSQRNDNSSFKDNQSKGKSLIKTRTDNTSENDQSKPKSLYSMFAKKNDAKQHVDSESPRREPVVLKELSPDMLVFVDHLYRGGYFNDANFLPRRVFDVSCFDDAYGRDFIKFAAHRFGKDNQEIAKWLSGSDLKSVALFGCPSLARKNIFAAKRLRIFFHIQEDTVCSKCILKQSCNFVNQSVWKGDTKNLNLVDVLKVVTLYALEAVPPQLVLPDEIKASVSRLLKEVINLSKTTP